MTWQSEITRQEWQEWIDIARGLSKGRRVNTSLGSDDYAAQAIEKLLHQENRPANIKAWLAQTIKNQYIDRFRKRVHNGQTRIKDIDDDQWEFEMARYAAESPSLQFRTKESVDEVLSVLTIKEKEILIMSVAGFGNHEIADQLGYRTNKIVATRLAQIVEKVKSKIQSSNLGSF